MIRNAGDHASSALKKRVAVVAASLNLVREMRLTSVLGVRAQQQVSGPPGAGEFNYRVTLVSTRGD